MQQQIYRYCGAYGRQRIRSLAPLFLEVRGNGAVIRSELLRDDERKTCRWLGFYYAKGVTSIVRDLSIFAPVGTMACGLHASLVSGFSEVDPSPLCYEEEKHRKGFGSFTRWVYFSSPSDETNFFGVDFSIAARLTGGVANSFLSVGRVVQTAVAHGLSPATRVVLLNARMQESTLISNSISSLGLSTAQDWFLQTDSLFNPGGKHCPRCGLRTLDLSVAFCFACGCRPELVWKNLGG